MVPQVTTYWDPVVTQQQHQGEGVRDEVRYWERKGEKDRSRKDKKMLPQGDTHGTHTRWHRGHRSERTPFIS